MRGSLQQRLQLHEEVPPPAAWNEISRRLDEEFHPSHAAIANKLDDFSVPPPTATWANIQNELDSSATITKRKVIPLFYRRMVAAASIAAILAMAAMYFFTGNSGITKEPASQNRGIVQGSTLPSAGIENRVTDPARVEEKDTPVTSKVVIADNRIRKKIIAPARKINNQELSREIVYRDNMEQAHISTTVSIPDHPPISVSAPPIRDRQGNIIMDLEVISKPGQQYITVTSPNGNPTRISNKFLDCLRYINANISLSEMDGDALECRMRFEEWRDRLLNDGSFIPAAGNFFDIVQMKEMIQD